MTDIISKIERMGVRIIDDFASRNWTDFLDDHLFTDKTGYFTRNWKWLDKHLFIEAGTFEQDVIKRIGHSAWQNEVRLAVKVTTKKIHLAVPYGLSLFDPTRAPIYCLINYLMSWAPAEVHSPLAPRILGAFPKQGIIAGIAGNTVDGQLIVFRPSDKFVNDLALKMQNASK